MVTISLLLSRSGFLSPVSYSSLLWNKITPLSLEQVVLSESLYLLVASSIQVTFLTFGSFWWLHWADKNENCRSSIWIFCHNGELYCTFIFLDKSKGNIVTDIVYVRGGERRGEEGDFFFYRGIARSSTAFSPKARGSGNDSPRIDERPVEPVGRIWTWSWHYRWHRRTLACLWST